MCFTALFSDRSRVWMRFVLCVLIEHQVQTEQLRLHMLIVSRFQLSTVNICDCFDTMTQLDWQCKIMRDTLGREHGSRRIISIKRKSVCFFRITVSNTHISPYSNRWNIREIQTKHNANDTTDNWTVDACCLFARFIRIIIVPNVFGCAAEKKVKTIISIERYHNSV